jgi:NADPH:quinone reductase-like Zn-dependent oxidoreductase
VATARLAGASEVLLHTDAAWPEKVRDITEGYGVHLAIDGIGGTMLSRTLSVVRPFGTVASLGQPAGPIPPVRVEELGFARSIALMRPSSLAYADDAALYRKERPTLCQHCRQDLKITLALNLPLPTQQKHTGFWRRVIQQEVSFSRFSIETLT